MLLPLGVTLKNVTLGVVLAGLVRRGVYTLKQPLDKAPYFTYSWFRMWATPLTWAPTVRAPSVYFRSGVRLMDTRWLPAATQNALSGGLGVPSYDPV